MKKKKYKIIAFSLYGSLAASHRVRLEQYSNVFNRNGMDLQIQSLLNNKYLRSKFSGHLFFAFAIIFSFFERIWLIVNIKKFDVAIIHCELFPFLPFWFENILLRIPYVYDFDDAFFAKYKFGKFSFLNFVLGKKFDYVIKGAAAVTAGNRYLYKYAKQFNSNSILLPTVVDTSVYRKLDDVKKDSDKFTIGWLGSPSTAKYLNELIEPLSLLGKECSIRFVVIGGVAPRIPNIEIIELPWSLLDEVSLINQFDVGVMPLKDGVWERGKCSFKLIQYMACGVPVIGSRVGSNLDVVISECGFLVDGCGEWLSALRVLKDNKFLRLQMGIAARKWVVSEYSLDRTAPIFAKKISQICNGN